MLIVIYHIYQTIVHTCCIICRDEPVHSREANILLPTSKHLGPLLGCIFYYIDCIVVNPKIHRTSLRLIVAYKCVAHFTTRFCAFECSHVDALNGSHFMYCEQHSLAYCGVEMLFVRSDHHCTADFTVFARENFVGAV